MVKVLCFSVSFFPIDVGGKKILPSVTKKILNRMVEVLLMVKIFSVSFCRWYRKVRKEQEFDHLTLYEQINLKSM